MTRCLSELLGSRSANPRQYANRLRAAGDLVALPQRGRFLYPAFQIDAERHAVREPVAEDNRVLGAADDASGVASWWLLPSATLGGTPLPMTVKAASTESEPSRSTCARNVSLHPANPSDPFAEQRREPPSGGISGTPVFEMLAAGSVLWRIHRAGVGGSEFPETTWGAGARFN